MAVGNYKTEVDIVVRYYQGNFTTIDIKEDHLELKDEVKKLKLSKVEAIKYLVGLLTDWD